MSPARKKRKTTAKVPEKALESIIGRAVLDEKFRDRLFKNPAAVRKEYNLTTKEFSALKKIKRAHLETFSDVLKSKLLKASAETIFC